MCLPRDELVTCPGCIEPLAQCELGFAPAPCDPAKDKLLDVHNVCSSLVFLVNSTFLEKINQAVIKHQTISNQISVDSISQSAIMFLFTHLFFMQEERHQPFHNPPLH